MVGKSSLLLGISQSPQVSRRVKIHGQYLQKITYKARWRNTNTKPTGAKHVSFPSKSPWINWTPMGGQTYTTSTRKKTTQVGFLSFFWMISPFLCSSPPSWFILLLFWSKTWMIGWLDSPQPNHRDPRSSVPFFYKREPRPFRSTGRPPIFWTCGEKSTSLHRIHEGLSTQ